MGIVSRAFRNVSRRKMRGFLVTISLGFCMAIMISIPAGIKANQESADLLTQNLGNTINETQARIEETLTRIDCSLTQSFEGFGFTRSRNFSGPGIRPNLSARDLQFFKCLRY